MSITKNAFLHASTGPLSQSHEELEKSCSSLDFLFFNINNQHPARSIVTEILMQNVRNGAVLKKTTQQAIN